MASGEFSSYEITQLCTRITDLDARIYSSGVDKIASSGSSEGSYGKATAWPTGGPTQMPSTSTMPMNPANKRPRWINEEHCSTGAYMNLAWPSTPSESHGYGYGMNGLAITSTANNVYAGGPTPLMSSMPMNPTNKRPRWTGEEQRLTVPNSKIAWPSTPDGILGYNHVMNGFATTSTVNNVYAGGPTQVPTSTIQSMKPSEEIFAWTNEDHMKLLQGLREYGILTTSTIEIADAGGSSHMQSTMQKKLSIEKITWTDEEHRNFLLGLYKFRWGDWKSFAEQCLRTKSVKQITSHSQKYQLAYYKDLFDPSRKKRSCINSSTLWDDGGNQLPLPEPPFTKAVFERLKLKQPQRDQALLYLQRHDAARQLPGNGEKVPQPCCNFPDLAPSECSAEPLQADNLSVLDPEKMTNAEKPFEDVVVWISESSDGDSVVWIT